MTKLIPLTRGLYSLIDDEDYETARQHSWQAHRDGWSFYAHRTLLVDGRKKGLWLHRLVLGLDAGAPDVDHVNGDGLDNRRSNLRPATSSQNHANSHHLPANKSGFRGVSFFPKTRKWRARIKCQRRELPLGYFDTPEEAARAYDVKAVELFGAFARPNFEAGAFGGYYGYARICLPCRRSEFDGPGAA